MHLSLRAKIALILSAVVVTYAVIDSGVQRVLIYDSFVDLEAQQARDDLGRALRTVQGEIAHLESDCMGSAASEETYKFAIEGDARSVEESILPQNFRARDLTLLYVCDVRGRVVWGRVRDPDTRAELRLRDFPAQELAATHPLMPRPEQPHVSGILMTEIGPLLVSAQPITGSHLENPSRGTLILGRRLDKRLVSRLGNQCGVQFTLWPSDSPQLPDDVAASRDEITASLQPVVLPLSETSLVAMTALPDVRGLPALIARAEIAREITLSGQRAVRYALTSTAAAGVLMMLVLVILLQRAVLKPIGALTRHAVEIGSSEDFTRRIGLSRPDEIGILAEEFDGLIERVEQSRSALVKAARAAGMSEIATGVLHNVGNVLNSVNVSATLVAQRAQGTGIHDLRKVVQALEPHAADLPGFLARDSKGSHLLPLLRSIAEELESERDGMRTEINAMCAGIDHVKELVQAQQGFAGRSGVLEYASISDQVEAALAFTGQALQDHTEIRIVREYDRLPSCQIDRHRLMEILVNLIQNARQALQKGAAEPCITLRIRALDGDRVSIQVADNGVGIAEENLARVFTHGFTTKEKGHGFGLHASANAAREMGGQLIAASDGPGLGATFTLELPMPVAAPVGAAT